MRISPRRILIYLLCLAFILYSFLILKKARWRSNKRQFMVYDCSRPCGGWGDRVRGLISSYAWSLLTNRTFLINIPHPCPFEELVIPNLINWNLNLSHFIEAKELDTNFTSYTFDRQEKALNLGKFGYIDLADFESDKDVIYIKINYEINTIFKQNKYVQNRLYELGYDESFLDYNSQIKVWFDKLFKLNPKLKEKYDSDLKKAKPSDNFTLICAQVRIGGKRPNVKDDMMFTSRNDTHKFWDHIKNVFVPAVKNDLYKIYLTTDTESVEEEAKQIFGDKLFTTEGLFVHIDRDGKRKDCSRFDKVVIDFFMYKNCDMSIITKNSSYGRYANFIRNDFRKNFLSI